MTTMLSTDHKPPRRTSADQWALEGLLLLVVLGSLVLGLSAALGVVRGDPVSAPVTFENGAVRLLERSEHAQLEVANPTLTIEDPSFNHRLLAAAPLLLIACTVGLTGVLLWRVVRSTRQGDPFHRVNARRLTIAAAAVLLGGSLASILDAIHSMDLAAQAPADFGLAVSGTLSFLPFAVGGVLAAMAGVFRRGTALRSEVEGLI